MTFLDKELQKILPNAQNGRTYADKLVQVYFLDGQSHWVLIHVEVQGEPEAVAILEDGFAVLAMPFKENSNTGQIRILVYV